MESWTWQLLLVCYSLSSVCGGLFSPSGLLCDFQKSPALGVRTVPHFSWIVPPCKDTSDELQIAYQITVASSFGSVWDSGKQPSNDSTYVAYMGPALNASTHYQWTVTTWTSSCQSDPSSSNAFVTALFDGWHVDAKFITTQEQATFGYFRKEVSYKGRKSERVRGRRERERERERERGS